MTTTESHPTGQRDCDRTSHRCPPPTARSPSGRPARSPRRRGRTEWQQAELRQAAVPRPAPPGSDRPVAAAQSRAAGQGRRRSSSGLEEFARTKIDNEQIERDARIPDEVVTGLAELGAFGMKIDEKYGGLGLSNLDYCRALMLIGSANPAAVGPALRAPVDRRTAAAQAVRHAGAEGEVPAPAGRPVRSRAFLLTETDVGSDPARLRTDRDADAGGRLPAQRRQAVGHQRHGGHAAGRHGPGAEVGGPPRRHHRVRGRERQPRASPSSGATRSSACAAWRTA